jgi:hypothetical protein
MHQRLIVFLQKDCPRPNSDGFGGVEIVLHG